MPSYADSPRRGGSRSNNNQSVAERTAPPVKPSEVSNSSNDWNPPGHKGIDLITNGPKSMYACVRAKVIDARNSGWWSKGATGDISKGDGVVRIQALEDVGDVKKGTIFGYGHAENVAVKVGQIVEPGDYLAKTGLANAWHTHWFVGRPGSDARDGDHDPKPYWEAFKNGRAELGASAPSGNDGSGAAGGIDAETAEKIAKATAFSTYLELPGLFNTFESLALQGERSLLNDQPLMPFVEQISRACLRTFQSLPNGDFYAFYPDYFGGLNHNTPYWDISDMEIIDGQIELSDDALATHVYVVGDIVAHFDGVDRWDKAQTGGVVTLFNAFLADFMNPTVSQAQREEAKGAKKDKKEAPSLDDVPTLASKDRALAFLRKYGARPYFEAAPMVRNPYYEAFLAYQTFCLMWSRQFVSGFRFTFMPELYPGGIVRMPEHGVQMFVEEVIHSFSYDEGFETRAVLSAPASTEGASGPNVHAGMIRAGALGVNKPANADDKK